jgi:PAS domain S-box-containing protein
MTLYHTGVSPLQKLPPSAFASQKQLPDFVLSRVSQQDRAEMYGAESTIHLSADAIVYTVQSGAVKMVNDAVTTVIGYSPDQLLWQNMKPLFIEADAEKVEAQVTLMQQGQSPRTFEMSVTCITDTNERLMCHLTLLGMSGSMGGIESFVVIMRDESGLARQQEETEAAKVKRIEYVNTKEILHPFISSRWHMPSHSSPWVMAIMMIVFDSNRSLSTLKLCRDFTVSRC